MKKSIIASFVMVALLTTGCTKKYEEVPNYQRIGSPTGAPAVIFYDYVENYQLTTYSTTSNILAFFHSDEYGSLVFDFQQGLSTLVSNGGDYKLARILTGGNLYLVGIDHDDVINDGEPNDESYIVGFGAETSIPVRVFKYLYPDISTNADYVSGADQIPAIINTKKYNTETVDYVIAAEPSLTNALSNVENPDDYHVIYCFKDKWSEETELPAVIPQAGLFINQTMYKEEQKYFDEFLGDVDNYCDIVINEPSKVQETINKYPSEFSDTIGVGGDIVYKVQTQASSGDPNGLAIVSSSDSSEFTSETLEVFLSTLGVDTSGFSDYYMF